MTKDFDIYEFTGLLAPGTVTLLGAAYLVPSLRPLLNGKDVSLGELGLFVVVAFVTGHLVQAVGSLAEPLYERVTGGRPSLEVQSGGGVVLASEQVSALCTILPQRLKLPIQCDIANLRPRAWLNLVAQMYAAVGAAGRSTRADMFYANYGLFRGLATAFLFLATLAGFQIGVSHPAVWSFLALSAISLYRLRRFSVYYAREVFVQFLQLPDEDAE